LLREYDNRWYLIGYVPERNAHLTFGLERITDAIYTEQKIYSDVVFDSLAFFQYSVGITETKAKKAEKVTIRVNPIPGRLIKTQPLHSSQVVTKDNEDFIEFKFDVYPSPELYAKLLSFGADLEVVSPVKIRNEFKTILEKALNRY
jgi:predicted DNA-binding transcriptional regulator YafY